MMWFGLNDIKHLVTSVDLIYVVLQAAFSFLHSRRATHNFNTHRTKEDDTLFFLHVLTSCTLSLYLVYISPFYTLHSILQ